MKGGRGKRTSWEKKAVYWSNIRLVSLWLDRGRGLKAGVEINIVSCVLLLFSRFKCLTIVHCGLPHLFFFFFAYFDFLSCIACLLVRLKHTSSNCLFSFYLFLFFVHFLFYFSLSDIYTLLFTFSFVSFDFIDLRHNHVTNGHKKIQNIKQIFCYQI